MKLIAVRYVTKEDEKGARSFIERYEDTERVEALRKSISEKPEFERFISETEYLRPYRNSKKS